MATLPRITELDEALYKVDALMGAAEAHGALCGMLCARGSADLSAWLDHVLGEQNADNAALHELVHMLSSLHQNTMEQLNDAMTEFYLLLPDDEDALGDRVFALTHWCQGYVYGLAAGGIKQGAELPADSNEIIRDIIEITRVGIDDDASVGEDDEIAFMEITEYVRTGILLVHEELQPMQAGATLQ